MLLPDRLSEVFRERFGGSHAFLARAPGRVNLIGEHTDYNDGFVLPMAIDRAVWVAARPRRDHKVVIYSLDFDCTVTFSLPVQSRDSGWQEYVKGVAWALESAGYALRGWEGVLVGDIPRGAGLSSSAALELAAARIFAAISDLPWIAADMAKIGQQAENQWVGMNCGIMDQMASAAGVPGHALLIDCRSLELEPVPLPPGTTVVILDTATRRGLVDSAYNERRAQCEAAARFFGVSALRDVTVEQVAALEGRDGNQFALDPVTWRRARHVVTENDRTLRAAEAMRRGDAASLGQLMDASHRSLDEDFEVSCDELNTMVACAQQEKTCLGARMTGAGFGGCAVALVRSEAAQSFAGAVAAAYEAASGLVPQVYICSATGGAQLLAAGR